MTHYSENPGMVRVDRFKESGKWYDTLEVNMADHYNKDLLTHTALKKAINEQMKSDTYVDNWLAQGGTFVCLEPYHVNAHPQMLKKHEVKPYVRLDPPGSEGYYGG